MIASTDIHAAVGEFQRNYIYKIFIETIPPSVAANFPQAQSFAANVDLYNKKAIITIIILVLIVTITLIINLIYNSNVDKPTINDVRDFYSILHALYRDKVKTPLFPLSFFEYLFNQDYARFFMVKYNNRLIGGRICVFLKGYTLYDWFACGEDGVYKNIYPSSVATYSSLIFAAKNNISLFDFMGAGKPNEDYGVRDFKASYGGILVEHGRFQNIIAPVLYRIGKLGISILKKV